MDYTKDMEMACELLHEQVSDLIRKIKNNGMSTGDLEKLDKLTHSLKSVKSTMKMEQEDEEDYSGRYPYWMGGTYADGNGGSMNTGSYARGRGRNARRDSMGRYSSRGYSRAEGDMAEIVEELKGMMSDLPEDKQREVQRFVEKVERM